MASHLQELLSPAIFNQQALFRQLGMRNRILNLPYSACGSVNSFMAQCSGCPRINSSLEDARLAPRMHKEGFLWVEATKVTQKALSKRFLTFPAILFDH